MYREAIEPERGKVSDGLLIIFAVIVILFFEPTLVLVGFPQAVKVTAQSVLCLLLILFCIRFYRKRLRSVRYTYITDREDLFGELEELTEDRLAKGTLIAETIVGSGAGTVIAAISPDEMRGFYQAGEDLPETNRVLRINATISSKRDASVLLYEQDGKMCALFFSPSAELAQALREQVNRK